jgi:hypothetical protein
MKKTSILQLLLIFQTILLIVYTVIVFTKNDPNLFSVFINNIINFNWNGQFSLDFSSYLVLSGIWIMWRNKFSYSSIFIGTIAAIIGIMVFAPYLLYLTIKHKGEMKLVLMGER